MANTSRASGAPSQPRLPAQPSNPSTRKRSKLPRSWAGLLVAFLIGAIVSGLITGAVVYALNDDQRVVTRTVTVPAGDAGTEPAEGAAAAAAPCAETARLAQQQLDVITTGLRQLGRLDTTGLQQTIDRLQGVQPDLQRAASACQSEASTP